MYCELGEKSAYRFSKCLGSSYSQNTTIARGAQFRRCFLKENADFSLGTLYLHLSEDGNHSPSLACPYGVSNYSGGKREVTFPDQSSSEKKKEVEWGA